MKYLKRFNESIEDVDSICRSLGITNYIVNPDGTVDVDGNVSIGQKNLTRLPLKFGRVLGNFRCDDNKLTTLDGCPTEVGGYFYCQYNQLTTLENSPQKVGGDFYCSNNRLTSLKGCPQLLEGGGFACHNNLLTTLDFCPIKTKGGFFCNDNLLTTLKGSQDIEVSGYFNCSNNQLTSLESCPKKVETGYIFDDNKITTINWFDIANINPDFLSIKNNPIMKVCEVFLSDADFNTTIGKKAFLDSLEWNYLKHPNIIIKSKFVDACEVLSEEIERIITVPEKIEGYIYE